MDTGVKNRQHPRLTRSAAGEIPSLTALHSPIGMVG